MRMEDNKESIWKEIGKTSLKIFIGGAVFWGWFSASGNFIPWPWIAIIAVTVVVGAAYWHFLKNVGESIDGTIKFFKGMREDISFIKEALQKKKR